MWAVRGRREGAVKEGGRNVKSSEVNGAVLTLLTMRPVTPIPFKMVTCI